jgi:hypothetical protein
VLTQNVKFLTVSQCAVFNALDLWHRALNLNWGEEPHLASAEWGEICFCGATAEIHFKVVGREIRRCFT